MKRWLREFWPVLAIVFLGGPALVWLLHWRITTDAAERDRLRSECVPICAAAELPVVVESDPRFCRCAARVEMVERPERGEAGR